MKKLLLQILNEYLQLFPEEQGRQAKLISYLNSSTDSEILDWNNFNGHIVAGGFIYSLLDKKFLVLYHKDLKKYLYPGGHIDLDDTNPLEAAKREILEETGLKNLKQYTLNDNTMIPIDIDTHVISHNERLNLPEHFHFDFRYLFILQNNNEINIDSEELLDFKWIDIKELKNDVNYGRISNKLEKLLNNL